MKKPEDLNEISGAKWDEMVKLYDEQVSDMLAAYCRNFSRYMAAEAALSDKGMLYKNPSGLVTTSPMINISVQMQGQMKKIMEYLEKHRLKQNLKLEIDRGVKEMLTELQKSTTPGCSLKM